MSLKVFHSFSEMIASLGLPYLDFSCLSLDALPRSLGFAVFFEFFDLFYLVLGAGCLLRDHLGSLHPIILVTITSTNLQTCRSVSAKTF